MIPSNSIANKTIDLINQACREAVSHMKSISNNAKTSYSELSSKIDSNANELIKLVENQRYTTNLMIIGDTKAGKSTTANFLTGRLFFMTANTAETYFPTMVFNNTKADAAPFEIEKQIREGNTIKKELIKLSDFQECFKILENLKRGDTKEEILRVEIGVKSLKEKSKLNPSLQIEDTPGMSEVGFLDKARSHLATWWGTSIPLVVVDTNSGTINLQTLEEALKVFVDNKCTERIIFIFTKVINHIEACKPDEFRTTSDEEKDLNLAITEANKTLSSFQEAIQKNYPNAKFILFDKNENYCKNYFYKPGVLKYEYIQHPEEKKEFISNKGLVNVGKASINYLEGLINDLEVQTAASIAKSRQRNKLVLIKDSITEIYQVYASENEIQAKVTKFREDVGNMFWNARKRFTEEIGKQLFPSENDYNTALYDSITRIFREIQSVDKEKLRCSKDNYKKYLMKIFESKFQKYLQQVVSGIYLKISAEAKDKLENIVDEFLISSSLPVNFSYCGNLTQMFSSVRETSLERVNFKSVMQVAQQTMRLTFDEPINATTATGFTSKMEGLPFLDVASLGLLLFAGAMIGGLAYATSWERDTVVQDLIKSTYEDFIKRIDLKEKMISSGEKIIELRKDELKREAFSYWQPKDDNIPGVPLYKELCLTRAKIERFIELEYDQ